MIPSGASLNATLWRTNCGDGIGAHEVGRQWLERMGWSCDRAMASRDLIPADAGCDVPLRRRRRRPDADRAAVLAAVDLDLTLQSVAAMGVDAQDRARPCRSTATRPRTSDCRRRRSASIHGLQRTISPP